MLFQPDAKAYQSFFRHTAGYPALLIIIHPDTFLNIIDAVPLSRRRQDPVQRFFLQYGAVVINAENQKSVFLFIYNPDPAPFPFPAVFYPVADRVLHNGLEKEIGHFKLHSLPGQGIFHIKTVFVGPALQFQVRLDIFDFIFL